jgi:hypothetical protein
VVADNLPFNSMRLVGSLTLSPKDEVEDELSADILKDK